MDSSGSTRWKGSQEYWEKLAEIYSGMFRDNPRSYIFVPLAGALYNAGMASKAADTLEMGLALLPNSRAGMVLLARLRNEAGDTDGAKALLLDIVSRWPDNTTAVTMLCGVYEREGLFAQAKSLASVLLDYFPDAKQAQKLYGKYSALAEKMVEPSHISPIPSISAQTEQELEPEIELELEPEPEPEVELELEPEPPAVPERMEEPSVLVAEAGGVMEEAEVVQPAGFEAEPEEISSEAQDENQGETRSRKRKGQAAGRASNDRQLTLVKLERVLLGISKLRK